MMLSKKIIIPVAIAAIGTAGIAGVGAVYAQTPNGQGLAQAIAQHFNLDQTQVQQVVDQFRSQQKANMQQNMAQKMDQRLSELVSQGKITNDQKTAIEQELNALKTKYNIGNFQGQSKSQIMQNMQNFQNDWQAWLKSQNIDPNILKPFVMGRGPRMWKGMHSPKPSPSPSATSQT